MDTVADTRRTSDAIEHEYRRNGYNPGIVRQLADGDFYLMRTIEMLLFKERFRTHLIALSLLTVLPVNEATARSTAYPLEFGTGAGRAPLESEMRQPESREDVKRLSFMKVGGGAIIFAGFCICFLFDSRRAKNAEINLPRSIEFEGAANSPDTSHPDVDHEE